MSGAGPIGGPVARECVEAYVFVADPLELLIVRRPPHRQGGAWTVVAGGIEPTDADREAAVRRELREETGFDEPARITPLDWHLVFRAENGETWRLHAYAVEVPRRFPPTLSDEHDGYAWVTPEEAIRRLRFPDNHEVVRRLVGRLGATP